jgi:small GTP-binding protein
VNLHGGPWVVRSMLDLARRGGFTVHERPTLPLPDEAVDAESALEREILANVPLARTELAIRELLGQREAWERLEALPAAERDVELAQVRTDHSLWWLLHAPRVAIVGAPNAGKSTLANQLFAQQRSITADLPGTTRDWVGEIANVDGLAVMLVDTPGIRQTTDPIEAAAIERSGAEIGAADLVVLVLDATRPLEPGQAELRRRFSEALVVINKCDRPAAWTRGESPAIETIAASGDGIDALRAAIRRHFEIDARRGQAKWWTPDQRKQLNLKSEI